MSATVQDQLREVLTTVRSAAGRPRAEASLTEQLSEVLGAYRLPAGRNGQKPLARYVCLDIETAAASEESIERAIAAWKPPARTKDPAKIEEARAAAEKKIRERAALLEDAPILCVAIETDQVSAIFNGMDERAYEIAGTTCVSAGDEREMLRALRTVLDAVAGDQTVLVGFNVERFDLPRLRSAFARHSLRLPKCLQPFGNARFQPVADVMVAFARYFAGRENGCISQSEVCQRLGLATTPIGGADVQGLYEAGEIESILVYCTIDVAQTALIWRRLAGTSDALD